MPFLLENNNYTIKSTNFDFDVVPLRGDWTLDSLNENVVLSRDTWLYNSSPLNTCWGCFPAFPPQRILHFQSQNVAPVFITHLVAVARQKKKSLCLLLCACGDVVPS